MVRVGLDGKGREVRDGEESVYYIHVACVFVLCTLDFILWYGMRVHFEGPDDDVWTRGTGSRCDWML